MQEDFGEWYDDPYEDVYHDEFFEDYEDEPEWLEPCIVCGEPDDGYTHVCDVAVDPHADQRDAQRAREVHGMRVSGRSTKTVLLPLLGRERKNARK